MADGKIEREICEGYLAARHDDDLLRKWFNKYNFLTIADISKALRINKSHLFRLRQRCGLIEAGPPTRMAKAQKEYTHLESVPSNWKDPEWIIPAMDTYGAKQIAALLGVTLKTVYTASNMAGRRIIIRHEFDNYEWFYEHYITKKMKASQMAKIAGVSTDTMKQWGVKYGFDRKYKNNAPIPMYMRVMQHELSKLPIVNYARFTKFFLSVSYKSGVVEKYHYAGQIRRRYKAYFITEAGSFINNIRVIMHVYGQGLMGECPYPAHTKVNRDFTGLTAIEKRIAIHTFLAEMSERKWIQMTHPIDVLLADLDRCKSVDHKKYFVDGVFFPTSYRSNKEAPGHYIAEHFFKFSFGPLITSKLMNEARYKSLLRFLKRRKSDLTFRNFMRFVCCDPKTKILFGQRFKFYRDFGSFYSILKELGVKGSVLDLSPSYGYNALAAAVAGLEYKYLPGHKIEKTLNNGFADFIGLKHNPYMGEHVGALVYHDFFFPDMDKIKSYYGKADRIIVFIPDKIKDEIVTKYKPEYLIKYRRNPIYPDINFLAIW
jgi:hypothetical protein